MEWKGYESTQTQTQTNFIQHKCRVGVCERVFTPVRWRQVRLSCIKWRSTFFYIFLCVRRSVSSSSSGWTAVAPTVMLGWRFCPADTRRENNVIMTLFPTTWHMITPDKIRSWPNRPCPINQSESILINQWKSRISDQSGHRIPHQLNLIGY